MMPVETIHETIARLDDEKRGDVHKWFWKEATGGEICPLPYETVREILGLSNEWDDVTEPCLTRCLRCETLTSEPIEDHEGLCSKCRPN